MLDQTRSRFHGLMREVFISDEVFKGELHALFDTCWIYVGHASELRNPGDFKARWVAGRPIIFVRGRDGEIRALINSCRHRGAIVCREREGNARQIFERRAVLDAEELGTLGSVSFLL